jgi:hypothetical protein
LVPSLSTHYWGTLPVFGTAGMARFGVREKNALTAFFAAKNVSAQIT